MTIEYKLINTIPSNKIDKSKIKVGQFAIGRTVKDFFGLIYRCSECKDLCAYNRFTVGTFLSDSLEPTFRCPNCKARIEFDKIKFKDCLYYIWNDDKYFKKWVVYIYSIQEMSDNDKNN